MSVTKNHESHYVTVLGNPRRCMHPCIYDANDSCLATGKGTAEKIYINML